MAVAIDPLDFDNDALKAELAQEIQEMSSADLERMAVGGPSTPKADEHGRLRGRIVEVRAADVLVDVGGKSEAYCPLDEFDAAEPPQPGQLHAFVLQGVETDTGMLRLSLREARTTADIENLRVGDVVEGRVTGVNIGGLELDIRGLRGFMPKSQVDLNRIDDFAPFVGHRMECCISEVNRRGRTLVLSRRRLLERQREEARGELLTTLAEGDTRKGVVRRLTDFGAFVDIGGVEGLLHIGDMSYARVKHPRDVLKEGDEIEVRILKIDAAKERISLGMKQLAPDPWTLVPANVRVGETMEGRVTKLMDFGAFVAVSDGVEGLIPISEISWTQRVRHPRDVLKEGDGVRVSVLAVDAEKRKITLSLKALSSDPWQGIADRYTIGGIVSGRVLRLADFGAFVELEEGVEGLVHISEMSEKRIRAAGDVCKPGDVVQVRVKAVDPEQRRISLSMRISEPAPAEPTHRGGPAAAPAAPKLRKKPLKGGLD